MSERMDAIVVLSGDFTEDHRAIGPDTSQRVDAGIKWAQSEDAPLIVSGAHPFIWSHAPPRPSSHLMKEYALERGMPDDMIVVQDKSLDTVGDAVFTKKEVTEPRGWRNLLIVTRDSHLTRSMQIFGRVMGERYAIVGASAGEAAHVKHQGLYELAGGLLLKAVLADTEPGDTEAIQERLFAIIPGYEEHSMLERVSYVSKGLLAR